MTEYETNFKISIKENSASPKALANALLKKLIEEKEDYVYLSFVLTRNTEKEFSEKVLSILRYANVLLENKESHYAQLLNSTDYIIECSLPIAKNEYGESINVLKGYGDGLRINKIKVRLVNKKDISFSKEIGNVIVSAKETSKSAGKVASRVVRTLVKDGVDCSLTFVLNKQNLREMSSKIMSIERIVSRMIKDPACVIADTLPNQFVNYEVTVYGPFIRKIESLNNKDVEVVANKIYFKCK